MGPRNVHIHQILIFKKWFRGLGKCKYSQTRCKGNRLGPLEKHPSRGDCVHNTTKTNQTTKAALNERDLERNSNFKKYLYLTEDSAQAGSKCPNETPS